MAATNERIPRGANDRIGLKQSLKLDKGFFIEHDVAEIRQGDFPFTQTVTDGSAGKPRIVLLAGKSLFLRGRDDLPVSHQAGRAIVIEGRDAQNIRHELNAVFLSPEGICCSTLARL